MKNLIYKAVGSIVLLLAFIQWITYDYPDMNPFWPGLFFDPATVSQVINWGVVAVLGATGWGIFRAGNAKKK